ncbi:hypothetical protein Pcinc_035856 [Petrolisthes cinctipes]|uniref:Secreted protein n=1 Tax=Petrolisthes cinctipes TaxID=88211 RepID=A0AAE1EN66_PETCI|nr:hypothetical protein Pcinc_035856 [Petrolisthes cinctipes]
MKLTVVVVVVVVAGRTRAGPGGRVATSTHTSPPHDLHPTFPSPHNTPLHLVNLTPHFPPPHNTPLHPMNLTPHFHHLTKPLSTP